MNNKGIEPKLTKNEFRKIVEESKWFTTFKKNILDEEPLLLNPITDSKNQEIGYVVQYRLKEDGNNDTLLQKEHYDSILNFIHYFDKKGLKTIVVDYSNAEVNGVIYLKDLDTNDVQEIKLDEDDKFVVNKDESELNRSHVVCWQCTKYKSGGGHYHSKCSAIVGGVCMFAGKVPYGRVICAGSLIIGCYVPKYKVCVQGSWRTTCPV